MSKLLKNLIVASGVVLLVMVIFFYLNRQIVPIKVQLDVTTQKNSDLESRFDNLELDLKNLKEALKKLQSRNQVDLSSIIKKWRPFVAHINCNFSNGVPNLGSALLTTAGKVYVITSKHIIIGDSGQDPVSCNFNLPDNTKVYSFTEFKTFPNIDFGVLIIENPDQYIKNLIATESDFIFCRKALTSIGDSIVILGYPVNGSKDDITATEGIISGYDGDYYITSAKIEHGNSGGVAILKNQNCYIGIPSFTSTGGIESLGRILSVNAMPIFK